MQIGYLGVPIVEVRGQEAVREVTLDEAGRCQFLQREIRLSYSHTCVNMCVHACTHIFLPSQGLSNCSGRILTKQNLVHALTSYPLEPSGHDSQAAGSQRTVMRIPVPSLRGDSLQS